MKHFIISFILLALFVFEAGKRMAEKIRAYA